MGSKNYKPKHGHKDNQVWNKDFNLSYSLQPFMKHFMFHMCKEQRPMAVGMVKISIVYKELYVILIITQVWETIFNGKETFYIMLSEKMLVLQNYIKSRSLILFPKAFSFVHENNTWKKMFWNVNNSFSIKWICGWTTFFF